MPKLLPALAAAALSAALVAAPAVAADAATAVTPAYTLTVTGDGARALVFWSAVRTNGTVITGARPESPITRLPWRQRVTPKAQVVQVTAVQQRGTKLRCTIRNSAGTVISSSMSLGRNAVVSCTVTKRDLFSLSALG